MPAQIEKIMNKNPIELIVRGVCIREGMLLLCRNRKVGNVFLPGGHIEPGESAVDALKREIMEEMALTCTPDRFLGVAESRFVQKGEEVCELNLVFLARIAWGTVSTPPQSVEEHLEFFWCPLGQVSESGMLPASLAIRLQGWIDGSEAVRFISMNV